MPTHDDHADDVLVSSSDLNVPDTLPHSPDLSVVVDQERIAAAVREIQHAPPRTKLDAPAREQAIARLPRGTSTRRHRTALRSA